MYTRRNIRASLVFQFAWRKVLIFSLWSSLVTAFYLQMIGRGVNCSLPIAPLGTIGVAVAFYIGFKNSQSYDRYWEARKIWGGIVNVSRAWANQVLCYVSAAHSSTAVEPSKVAQTQKSLIYRHLAWINVLRCQLRRKTSFGFEPKGAARRYMQSTDLEAMKALVESLLPQEELRVVCSKVNSATQILRLQGEQLRKTNDEEHLIEEFRLISLMDLITEMYALQGKCERIKNTPFPRQYAYFSRVFTLIFIFLLPFGLVGEMASRGGLVIWMTVPISVIVSWMFYTMESVGDASEDPFENFVNDVPMSALCRTIEIDLRQMLGETDTPEPLQPVDDILM